MSSPWLLQALEESRERGFLGPGPVDAHVRHSEGFAQAWESHHPDPPTRFLDLGAGGGIPGLVLIERWLSPAVLLDSSSRRTAFLAEVLGRPGAPSGAQVVTERAEVAARDPRFDSGFDLVVARSFGPPAVTAECAARFTGLGGTLIVAEPPDEDGAERWSEEPLRELGWALEGVERHGARFCVLSKVATTPDLYPRGVGRPAKRPLF